MISLGGLVVFGTVNLVRRPALLFALALAACAPPAPPDRPTSARADERDDQRFSGARALRRVRALLELPRALGDPRRAASIDALSRELAAFGHVRRLEHRGQDPRGGAEFAMTTLVAMVRPGATRRFILGTHFDTRPWAEEDPDPARREQPIPGANDGTSGLAVLLELTPLLARQLPADVGFTIVLFDGEELGRPGLGGYCAGSLALAEELRDGGAFADLRRAEFAVVLDMVGERGLELELEPYSLDQAEPLARSLWSMGAGLGYAAFVDRVHRTAVFDDHVPLARAGVPAILLIDHDYAPWHTHADTIDELSAESLEAVGETLRRFALARYE